MRFRLFAAAALAVASSAALSQDRAAPSGRAVAGGATSAPASEAPYRSTLRDFRAFDDEPLMPWRQANDTVLKIGGWKAYAREAQSAQRDATPAADPAMPRSAPGSAHEIHHGARR